MAAAAARKTSSSAVRSRTSAGIASAHPAASLLSGCKRASFATAAAAFRCSLRLPRSKARTSEAIRAGVTMLQKEGSEWHRGAAPQRQACGRRPPAAGGRQVSRAPPSGRSGFAGMQQPLPGALDASETGYRQESSAAGVEGEPRRRQPDHRGPFDVVWTGRTAPGCDRAAHACLPCRPPAAIWQGSVSCGS